MQLQRQVLKSDRFYIITQGEALLSGIYHEASGRANIFTRRIKSLDRGAGRDYV
jgi:hypothetical protein